jgi:hypothetical protein
VVDTEAGEEDTMVDTLAVGIEAVTTEVFVVATMVDTGVDTGHIIGDGDLGV